MRRRSDGTTLMEIIFSMMLMGIFMVISANFVSRCSTVIHQQDAKDRALANMSMILDSVSGEIEEALAVDMPAADDQSTPIVRLRRLNPEDPPDVPITGRSLIFVEYSLHEGTLVRSVRGPGGVGLFPIAHEVASFSVRREHEKLYTIRVAFQEAYITTTMEGKACLKSGI